MHMSVLFLSPAELGQGQYRRLSAFFGGPAHNPELAAPDPPASTSAGRLRTATEAMPRWDWLQATERA